MSDYLIRLGGHKLAGSLVKGLGIPVPKELAREHGAWEAEPLAGETVCFSAGEGAQAAEPASAAITATGAEICAEVSEDARPRALVFDATGIETLEALDELHAFFHPRLRALAPCGRALVLARPPALAGNAVARAARRAVEGFVRSMGRELGRKGSTANMLYVDDGAESRIGPVIRFLLSKRSAFISGQALHVNASIPETAPVYEKPLAGKVALVTGSARGIGAATARALAREGAKVIVMDVPGAIDAAKAVAEETGGEALACDITADGAGATLCAYIEAHHGGIDVAVHNAGITRDKMLANMDAERWNLVLEVNLRALIRVNEALLGRVRDQGRIVCLSSIGGIAGNVGQTNYAATKAGVIGYVEGLAVSAAARGIAVNAVAPGFIETDMTAKMPMGTREFARRLSNLSQGGQPEDIAEAITFLASPGAHGVTGNILRVCGGSFIGA